ncbi:hypothetical protein WG66_002440 [Moniliophthora roreri]|uniref:Uncharacterized protein n=1 Tax=Moniliophthora roreri TaxID=221103 RepID=A0A0W0F877_MONRR|nr:hypothetical protein WG66_002440 [Moniliophthora roreri]
MAPPVGPIIIQPRTTHAPMTSAELKTALRALDPTRSSQIPAVTSFIDDAEHDIELYEGYIQQLRVRQAVLTREVAEYKSLKSPIRRLPSEILRSIFFFTSKYKPNCFGVNSVWRLPALDMSAVCRRWRDIAIAYPSLWTNMLLDLDHSARAVASVQLYLIHSQQQPLSFRVVGPFDGDDNAAREILISLLDQSHRWLSVDLDAEDIEELVTGRNLDVSALRSAHLFEGSFLRLEAFSGTQKLESLSTFAFPKFIPTGAQVNMNLRHLAVQHTDSPSLRSLLTALPTLPKLESLDYHGMSLSLYYSSFGEPADYSVPIRPLAPVTSHVSSVSLHLWDTYGVYPLLKDIFSSLLLPSLVELKIQGGCRIPFNEAGEQLRDKAFSGEWPRATVHDFITTSSCHLTTLVLSGMPISDVDVIAMLYITPDLVDFTLHELWAEVRPECGSVGARPNTLNVGTVTKRMMEQLQNPAFDSDVFTEQRNALVPKLRKLSLRVLYANWEANEADEEFVKMVRSRWLRPLHRISENDLLLQTAQLRTVELTVVGIFVPHEEVYKPLKRLEREGLMFTIRIDRSGCGDGEYFV